MGNTHVTALDLYFALTNLYQTAMCEQREIDVSRWRKYKTDREAHDGTMLVSGAALRGLCNGPLFSSVNYGIGVSAVQECVDAAVKNVAIKLPVTFVLEASREALKQWMYATSTPAPVVLFNQHVHSINLQDLKLPSYTELKDVSFVETAVIMEPYLPLDAEKCRELYKAQRELLPLLDPNRFGAEGQELTKALNYVWYSASPLTIIAGPVAEAAGVLGAYPMRPNIFPASRQLWQDDFHFFFSFEGVGTELDAVFSFLVESGYDTIFLDNTTGSATIRHSIRAERVVKTKDEYGRVVWAVWPAKDGILKLGGAGQ